MYESASLVLWSRVTYMSCTFPADMLQALFNITTESDVIMFWCHYREITWFINEVMYMHCQVTDVHVNGENWLF